MFEPTASVYNVNTCTLQNLGKYGRNRIGNKKINEIAIRYVISII